MDRSARRSPESQSTGAVLMVRPARFGHNPETAASNAFQSVGSTDAGRSALEEFDGVVRALQRADVAVMVAEDTASPSKPDAIFPNNWVSFHGDGTAVLYPMLAPNRRAERREDILRQVTDEGGYRIDDVVDLTRWETSGKYLEGTGSLVLDRVNRLAYASLSARTDLDVLGEFARTLDFELVTFEAVDAGAKPVYHTNVVMAIGSRVALFCGAAVPQDTQRTAVRDRLRSTGHRVIDLSSSQMHAFAGNVLELASAGGPVIAMSQSAWASFDPGQRRMLESCGSIVAPAIPVIEGVGGGGVRCMLAEIHLPRRIRPLLS